jgi:hypothetical protein
MRCSPYLPLIYQTSVCIDRFSESNGTAKRNLHPKKKQETDRLVVNCLPIAY